MSIIEIALGVFVGNVLTTTLLGWVARKSAMRQMREFFEREGNSDVGPFQK